MLHANNRQPRLPVPSEEHYRLVLVVLLCLFHVVIEGGEVFPTLYLYRDRKPLSGLRGELYVLPVLSHRCRPDIIRLQVGKGFQDSVSDFLLP